MASTLIKGKYIITRVTDHDEVEVVTDGAVYQKDGEIIAVGKYRSLKARYKADEEIGSDQHLVLPGLVNAHLGGALSSNLMGIPDDSLERWSIPLMVGQRSVDPYLNTMYGIAQLIEGGVTTVMHLHFPRGPGFERAVTETLRAYVNGGIRVAFAPAARNQNHLVYQDDETFLKKLPPLLAMRLRKYLTQARVSEDEYFDVVGGLFKKYGKGYPKLKILLGVSGPQWCSDELLGRIKQTTDEYQTGIHTHMVESIYQKEYALKTLGKTFPEHFYELGLMGPKVSFAHCVWVTERDIELCAETGTSIIHNPSSNLRLRSGIAPVNMMLAKGVNVTLGMDSHSLSDNDDMLLDLRLCANLHRTPGWEKLSINPGRLLKMATVNGAKATLFGNQIGTLEKGKRADIILLNLKRMTQPYLDPEADIVDILLARGKASDIDTVMVDGEILLRDRKLTRINKDEIAAAIRETLARQLKPFEIERKKLAKEIYPHVLEFYRNWHIPEMNPYYIFNSVQSTLINKLHSTE